MKFKEWLIYSSMAVCLAWTPAVFGLERDINLPLRNCLRQALTQPTGSLIETAQIPDWNDITLWHSWSALSCTDKEAKALYDAYKNELLDHRALRGWEVYIKFLSTGKNATQGSFCVYTARNAAREKVGAYSCRIVVDLAAEHPAAR